MHISDTVVFRNARYQIGMEALLLMQISCYAAE